MPAKPAWALGASVLLLLSIGLCPILSAEPVDSKRLIEAAREPQNWLIYSGTYDAWRYSPLDQINRENVKRLAPAWIFQTGKVDGGFSCTPLVADGVM